MAESKARAGSSAHRAVTLFGDHRTNDVILGHVGRITYHPKRDDDPDEDEDDEDDNDDVGDLTFNRVAGQSALLSFKLRRVG